MKYEIDLRPGREKIVRLSNPGKGTLTRTVIFKSTAKDPQQAKTELLKHIEVGDLDQIALPL